MDAGLTSDLQDKIYNICNILLNNNKLITTKSVLLMLSELQTEQGNSKINNVEDYITKVVNLWRLSRVGQSIQSIQLIKSASNDNNIEDKNYRELYKNHQKLSKCNKQLIKANREIQFLKAKIKALNSFYSRQRQEFIMRIEGMLYK